MRHCHRICPVSVTVESPSHPRLYLDKKEMVSKLDENKDFLKRSLLSVSKAFYSVLWNVPKRLRTLSYVQVKVLPSFKESLFIRTVSHGRFTSSLDTAPFFGHGGVT